ncbi:hypothetical protein DL96DRAFT_1751650 [Flagelloscypha sp. PMI_526]|nr:hypothetical protein DL96DRAFT_1751650 [Flagelloscypha sp. PMI_526]
MTTNAESLLTADEYTSIRTRVPNPLPTSQKLSFLGRSFGNPWEPGIEHARIVVRLQRLKAYALKTLALSQNSDVLADFENEKRKLLGDAALTPTLKHLDKFPEPTVDCQLPPLSSLSSAYSDAALEHHNIAEADEDTKTRNTSGRPRKHSLPLVSGSPRKHPYPSMAHFDTNDSNAQDIDFYLHQLSRPLIAAEASESNSRLEKVEVDAPVDSPRDSHHPSYSTAQHTLHYYPPLLPLEHSPGLEMFTEEFCNHYELSKTLETKLINKRIRRTQSLMCATEFTLARMGFDLGERALLRNAVEAWSVPRHE